jgi:hypothetical protein
MERVTPKCHKLHGGKKLETKTEQVSLLTIAMLLFPAAIDFFSQGNDVAGAMLIVAGVVVIGLRELRKT